MKKTILFGMAAASVMMLAASCSSSDVEETATDQALVSFKISADTKANIRATRAISDGTGTNQLTYRVFDKDGAIITTQALKSETATDLLTGHTVTLALAKGQTYKVAFWAQNSNCTAYTVDENMNVAVSYDGENNDETRDAFFKTVDVTVTGNMSESVTLTRPFAQINVANTDADKTAAAEAGTVITESAVTIKNAATSLSVLTGKVSGSEDVTYTSAAIPTEKLSVDIDGDGTKEDYNYLSMCYVLPNDETTGAAATVAEAAFTFAPKSGEAIELKDGLQNIPLQRNYRTNIVGNLLASTATFTVKVDPAYEGEYNQKLGPVFTVSTSDELATAALTENAIITLSGSAAFTLPTSIADGVTIKGETQSAVIEANTAVTYGDKNVKFENLTYKNKTANYIGLQHAASVSYKNCVITGRPTMYATTATFDNCTFKQDTYDYCIWTYGSQDITFNNCKFETKGKAVKIYNESPSLVQVATFNNCEFKATDVESGNGKAAIEIDGSLNTTGSYTVYINNCTEDGMVAGKTSGEKMWNCDENSNTTTVYVDGTKVYENGNKVTE
jgi:hypothetical protein